MTPNNIQALQAVLDNFPRSLVRNDLIEAMRDVSTLSRAALQFSDAAKNQPAGSSVFDAPVITELRLSAATDEGDLIVFDLTVTEQHVQEMLSKRYAQLIELVAVAAAELSALQRKLGAGETANG